MTVTDDRPTAEVGAPRRRKEDARLITGRTNWTDNIVLPGMLHMAILRSPMAHARITAHRRLRRPLAARRRRRLHRRRHRRHPGHRCRAPGRSPRTSCIPNHPPLAVDEVRHTGEPVAVVVARSQAAAVDALAAIDVDYETLPVVLDMEAAHRRRRRRSSTPDKGTNKSYTWIFDSRRGRHRRQHRRRVRRTPTSSSSGGTSSSG